MVKSMTTDTSSFFRLFFSNKPASLLVELSTDSWVRLIEWFVWSKHYQNRIWPICASQAVGSSLWVKQAVAVKGQRSDRYNIRHNLFITILEQIRSSTCGRHTLKDLWTRDINEVDADGRLARRRKLISGKVVPEELMEKSGVTVPHQERHLTWFMVIDVTQDSRQEHHWLQWRHIWPCEVTLLTFLSWFEAINLIKQR